MPHSAVNERWSVSPRRWPRRSTELDSSTSYRSGRCEQGVGRVPRSSALGGCPTALIPVTILLRSPTETFSWTVHQPRQSGLEGPWFIGAPGHEIRLLLRRAVVSRASSWDESRLCLQHLVGGRSPRGARISASLVLARRSTTGAVKWSQVLGDLHLLVTRALERSL